MTDNERLAQYFSIIRQYGGSPGNWSFYFRYIFEGVDFEHKTMLDIGGGIGRASLYAACKGAEKVVCLEPEVAGSRFGMLEKARDMRAALDLAETVALESSTFQDFDAGGQRFDIVLLHNSINHLDEEACRTLHTDSKYRKVYTEIFGKLGALSRLGTKLILADCSRYNFFAAIGLRNPFAPTIAWDIHQPPELWAELLSDFDFVNPRIRWTTHNRLRSLGRLLFGNKLASYFGRSAFCLTMEKAM